MGFFIIFWLVCSVLVYGFTFAYVQKQHPMTAKYNYKDDIQVSIALAIFGPFSLLSLIVNSFLFLKPHEEHGELFKHGLKFF